MFGRVMALGLWNFVKYLVITTFFAMIGDIDLIFGTWVYNDKLQIKFTFHSGPMIFGGVMHLDFEIWPNTFVFSCHHFFFAMLGDIDLIFCIWVTDQVYISFRSNDFLPSYRYHMAVEPWNLAKYLVITILFHRFEIFTWFLVWECIVISYRSTLKFIPVECFLANLQLLGFEIWPNI